MVARAARVGFVPPPHREPELTQPVDLCLPNGSLNPDARGWARRDLHRYNLHGHLLRKKRWSRIAVAAGDHLFTVSIADLGYAGVAAVTLLDRRLRTVSRQVVTAPFARGVVVGRSLRDDAHFEHRALRISFDRWARGVRLRVSSPSFDGLRMRASIWVEEPASVETFASVLAWDPKHFELTAEKMCLPASGAVELPGTSVRFDHHNRAFAFACFSGGVWPFVTGVQQLSACGVYDRRSVGLSALRAARGGLDGQSPADTSEVEASDLPRGNDMAVPRVLGSHCISIDGRLYPIAQDLRIVRDGADPASPWRIFGAADTGVDLVFTPEVNASPRRSWPLARNRSQAFFGSLCGSIRLGPAPTDVLELEQITAWAQEQHLWG